MQQKRCCIGLRARYFMSQVLRAAYISTIVFFGITAPVYAVNVLTQHNDNNRTGANLNETTLTTSNVNVNQFGLVAVRSVDGQLYAEPLYVPNVAIPGKGTHNVIYLATEHDSVYAFDADDPNAQLPLWQTTFINPGAGVTTVPSNDVGVDDISPEIGITGTPVIDTTSGTIYLVAKTKEVANGTTTYAQRLHALDITTGLEKFGGPVVIQGAVPGVSIGDDGGGHIPFLPLFENQRCGLLLLNGAVYIGWASHGDNGPYHGWVIGYNAATLAQTSMFSVNPNGIQAGIWQGGNGLAADSSYIYLMSGNGTFDANVGGVDYGESFVKLSTSGGLAVTDWFTPYDYDTLNAGDLDLGASGPLLIPGTNFVVGGGKEGILYLLNTANMGHFQSGSNSQVVQSWQASTSFIEGGQVYWSSPSGPLLYVWGVGDYLKSYRFNGATFNTSPASRSAMPTDWPGGLISLSANGGTPGTGILWGTNPNGGGILRAFDATNLSSELWNSAMNPVRDNAGSYIVFSAPMIANGRVYLNTSANHLYIYGLLPTNNQPDVPNNLAAVNGGSNVSLSWSPAARASTYSIYRSVSPNAEGATPFQIGIAAPSFTDTAITSGTKYYYKVTAVNANGETSQSSEVSATPVPESPYLGAPVSLPGTVQAENYDVGGEGLAYHDFDPTNNGGVYRPDEGVDLAPTSDFGGGYIVGWVEPGEWTNYTVNVAAAGTYTIVFRVASFVPSGSFHLEAGGVAITPAVGVPNTGGWDIWQSVVVRNVSLNAGSQIIKMVIDTVSFNWNYFEVLSGDPDLTSIAVAPSSISLQTGTTHLFTAAALDQIGNLMPLQPAMTWSVSGGGSIDANGVFTAGGSAGGTFTVTAASGAVSGSASVTVSFVPVLTSITVSPSTAQVAAGASQQFIATARDQSGDPMPAQPVFTWSVSGGGVINSDGLLTAGSVPGGPFMISVASGSVSGASSMSILPISRSDINDDGHSDLILQNSATNQIASWSMNGSTVLSGKYISFAPAAGWRMVGNGDFNGDGSPDLVLQNDTTNQVAIWYLNGTALFGGAYLSVTPPADWKVVSARDIDGDGKPDLVLQNALTNQVAIWYLDGVTLLSGQYLSLVPAANWRVVGMEGINGDGKPDLILQNTTTNQLAVWYLNGASVTSAAYISLTPALSWKAVAVGDFNDDEMPDIVLQDTVTNGIAIWYLNGANLLSGSYVPITPPAGWNVEGPR